MKALLPPDELQRLEELLKYEVLDTPAEESFDDLTELAAHICQAPIALITLIDEKRQWFKSRVGLSISETSRDVAFCAHAIRQPELYVVPDATRDPRFADNPLVTAEPNIRFYAGAPLISPSGHALGTLCVIDREPRTLSSDHQKALRVLGRHVMAQLELRRRSLEAARLRAERDDTLAELQRERAELERRVEQRTEQLQVSEREARELLEIAEKSRAALRDSEERLRLAVKASRIGLWEWDVASNRVFASPEWKHLIGCEDNEVPKTLDEWETLLHPDDKDRIKSQLAARIEGRSSSEYRNEFRLRHKDGTYRWIYTRSELLPDNDGKPVRMLGCHLDISERMESESALRESEERYRQIVELSPDAITIHQEGRWVFANSAAARILNVADPAQLVGRSLLEFMHPEIHQQVKARWKQLYEDKQPVNAADLKMMNPDGTIVHLDTRAIPIDWEGRPAAQVIARDVTERIRADEALRDYAARLQGLSRRLMEVEENERRNINRELHDRMGQSLSALSLSLDLIRSKLSKGSLRAVGKRLDIAQKLLESSTTQVRNVMAELHPPALEDYGLLAALRTYADSLSAGAGNPIAVNGKDLAPRMSPRDELALFRIAQGALTNAVTHARATTITVDLAATQRKTTLAIVDDGVGFDIARVGAARATWGLTIMRERAEAIGATLKIESDPGRGTRVVIELPRDSG